MILLEVLGIWVLMFVGFLAVWALTHPRRSSQR